MKFKFDKINLIYVLAGLVFLVAIGLAGWFSLGFFRDDGNIIFGEEPDENIVEEKCAYVRKLDGVCVASQDKINPAIVGVMIENHPDARPQAGLSRASIVYEAPVEADITRFLAIFPGDLQIEKVGPVRSARPYYLEWIKEYGTSLYFHIGGSEEALQKIKTYQIVEADEFAGRAYVWRASNRYAPHNVFTASERWNEALEDYKTKIDPTYESWEYAKNECLNDCISQINIPFSTASYEVAWKFNTSTKNYIRYLAGERHLDEDGAQIFADNIIIQKAKISIIDAVGRKKINTTSSGEAIIFSKGNLIRGTWKKDSLTSRTMFYDSDGKKITLNPGKTWVEVAPEYTKVTYE